MIYFIVPEYVKNCGNCSRIGDTEEERVAEKTVNSVLKAICRERCIDFRGVRRKSKRILGQSNLIPVYIGPKEVLVSVKMRIPKVSRDGGYGYVNVEIVDNIMDKYISLKDGTRLFYLDSKRCIIKRFKMATILMDSFKSPDAFMQSPRVDLRGPATREDIAVILDELIQLKRRMEELL